MIIFVITADMRPSEVMKFARKSGLVAPNQRAKYVNRWDDNAQARVTEVILL